LVKRFFFSFWAERTVWGDMQRCNSVSNRISDLGEHLLNINTHKFTCTLVLELTKTQKCTHTHRRRHTHTHISKAASIRAQQFSSSPISPVSTVTAGWAPEFCDAPFQSCSRMNGLSVLSAVSPRPNCLSWTGNDKGMWWHNSASGGSLV